MLIACYIRLIISGIQLYHFQHCPVFCMLLLLRLPVCVCAYGHATEGVEIWGHPAAISSFFSPCRPRELDSGQQALHSNLLYPLNHHTGPHLCFLNVTPILEPKLHRWGWGCGSVREGVAIMHEALDLIISVHMREHTHTHRIAHMQECTHTYKELAFICDQNKSPTHGDIFL